MDPFKRKNSSLRGLPLHKRPRLGSGAPLGWAGSARAPAAAVHRELHLGARGTVVAKEVSRTVPPSTQDPPLDEVVYVEAPIRSPSPAPNALDELLEEIEQADDSLSDVDDDVGVPAAKPPVKPKKATRSVAVRFSYILRKQVFNLV
jgi:hypothetical protein